MTIRPPKRPQNVACHVRVIGIVQDVFFRAWAREEAQRLGITGWVRNCPDGSVEAHVDGDIAAVEQMISRLRKGPDHASVMNVEVSETEPDHSDRFEVRY